MMLSRPLTPPSAPLLAIFDHDGVLVDSLDNHTQAWLEMGRRAGLPVTPDFVHATFGLTNFSIVERLLGDDYTRERAIELGDLKEACYRELARGRLDLMPGVRALLEGLRQRGVLLAIGSSGPRANLLLTVEECGLMDHFQAIVGLEDITRGKPDPEVFLTAASRCGVPPQRAVVFEDAVFGIQAAKAAGMTAVGVTSSHPAEALREAGADVVVDSLDQFDFDAWMASLG